MPRRIVVNCCFGGFNLSDEAKNTYKILTADVPKGPNWYANEDIARDDPVLLAIIDSIGLQRTAGLYCKLAIIEIPDDFPEDGWTISQYDGQEWVAEKHRKWFHETPPE